MDTTQISAARKPYVRVNGTWPEGPLPIPSPEEAVKAAKQLFRLGTGKAWGERPVKIVSGNRHTWVRYGTLNVNPNRTDFLGGWRSLVHNLSHLAHRQVNRGKAPHDPRHAGIERRMIEHVVASGWLNGKLRKAEKPKPDIRAVRHQRVLAGIARWEAKERRAKAALKKLRTQQRYYERALAA